VKQSDGDDGGAHLRHDDGDQRAQRPGPVDLGRLVQLTGMVMKYC